MPHTHIRSMARQLLVVWTIANTAVASEYRGSFRRTTMSSGIEAFDRLLGGGVETGSSTLVLGPAGTGKSLAAIVFIVAAIARGEKAALFVFDEELGLLFDRMKGLGIDLKEMQRSGKLFIDQVDAASASPYLKRQMGFAPVSFHAVLQGDPEWTHYIM